MFVRLAKRDLVDPRSWGARMRRIFGSGRRITRDHSE